MNKLERLGQTKLNERYFKMSAHEYTVYVEGDIDILFWEKIFPKRVGWKPNVSVLKNEEGKVLGGWQNLLSYLEENIKNKEKINYIIAIDGDYNAILKNKNLKGNIVITRRYNIENYIFCPNSLYMYMKKLSFGIFNNKDKLKRQIDKFTKIMKKIIILDCINVREGLGIEKYGLQKRDLQTIWTFRNSIYKLEVKYREEIEDNSDILNNINLSDFIRWKCFLNQLNMIIEHTVKKYIVQENESRTNNKVRIPKRLKVDELYMNCIDNCRLCTDSCDDYKSLQMQAENALNELISS